MKNIKERVNSIADAKEKQTARIDNWFKMGDQLAGVVSGHPRQGEFRSEAQVTSRIIDFNEEEGYCETKNTVYVLGEKAEYAT